jgi:isochorismate synthase
MQADLSADSPVVRDAASRARRLRRPVLASWTQRTSGEAIGFFAQAAGMADRGLWLRPASGEAMVGIGAAKTLVGDGADRFTQISDGWLDLLADAVIDDGLGGASGGPLLLGGFRFDQLSEPTPLWDGYPDARLVLPARMLVVHDGAAWLTTNMLVAPDGSYKAPLESQTPRAQVRRAGGPSLSPAAWQTLVGSVARSIRHGRVGLEKVVLARALQVQTPNRRLDPQTALRNLAASYPSCTVFALAHQDACFLGATPERLISLHDGTASTMALAGSVPRGASQAEDDLLAEQLMQSAKERAEHAFVVGALRDGLAQICSRIIADTQPRVRKLANVQHLFTPIHGQVAAGYTVLDLVERLHPTPAVGGFPRQRAMELIREREALDRGWYAGPLGWLNRHGEGEFVVGIRSALVRGDTATLFAGCGIVSDSDPATEFAESGWKLRPMLTALDLET